MEGLSDSIWPVTRMLNAQGYIKGGGGGPNEGTQMYLYGKSVPCKRHSAQGEFSVTQRNESEQYQTTTVEFLTIYVLFFAETLLSKSAE
jgi:hypothetical protein